MKTSHPPVYATIYFVVDCFTCNNPRTTCLSPKVHYIHVHICLYPREDIFPIDIMIIAMLKPVCTMVCITFTQFSIQAVVSRQKLTKV